MTTIIIKTQKEFDKIKDVKVDEELICECELSLKCNFYVYGRAIFKKIISTNASVVARDNASVEAWGNASVVARDNASVVAWGNASVRIYTQIKSLVLFGFSVCFKPFDLKIKIKKSETAHIQNIKPLGWFENNGITKTKTTILYKKVSKDFLTQEGTKNETKWEIGATVTHPNWKPEQKECGDGKFHACSRPYFCDEFRNNNPGDIYIALLIKFADVYEWKNYPQYPHKIGFREGKVLYECDKFGVKLEGKGK
jgi:hypothetical protein